MDDGDVLRSAEVEMLAEAARAAVAAWQAIERMRAADAALGALRSPSWGPAVAEWHRAAGGLSDALETVDAYRAFEPRDWWGSWR